MRNRFLDALAVVGLLLMIGAFVLAMVTRHA